MNEITSIYVLIAFFAPVFLAAFWLFGFLTGLKVARRILKTLNQQDLKKWSSETTMEQML